MALVELDLLEVEVTVAPKTVIFGSADETIQPAASAAGTEKAPFLSGTEGDTEGPSGLEAAVEPNLLGLALVGLGIGLAVWLGRRGVGRRES